MEKVLIYKRILFKKIAIMHGIAVFSKIKGNICNIPIEASNICNIFSRPTVSNGLIVAKIKLDLKNQVHGYFKPVRPHIVNQVLTYSKSHNKFCKNISIWKLVSSEDMFEFSDSVERQAQTERDRKK